MALDGAELRRLRWRCRRGLLENDLVLARFLAKYEQELDAPAVAALGELLELDDHELWDLVSGRRDCTEPRFAALVDRLRAA